MLNCIKRMVLCDAIALHILASFVMAYYCRVKMLCLLIAHGIFLRQEASQSRRAIMKRVPDLQRPTWRMLDQVPVRYPPHARAVSRV